MTLRTPVVRGESNATVDLDFAVMWASSRIQMTLRSDDGGAAVEDQAREGDECYHDNQD